VDDNKFTFRIIMAGGGDTSGDYALAKAYGVQAYPTNYLVGADGKILWRSLGFDETGLRQAVEKAVK
jgi:hypothetical protein